MKDFFILGFIFILIMLIGFYLAYLYGRRTKKFRWSEYFAIISLPIIFIIIFAYFINVKIIILFFISSLFGFLLEYIIGLTYHKALNKKLWTYDRLSFKGYNSFLSVPLWGIAGVSFWLLSKVLGL